MIDRTLTLLTAALLSVFGIWTGTTGAHAQSGAAPGIRLPDVMDLPVQAGMPDPLVNGDGTRITTAKQWQKHRAEMKRLIEYYAIGTMPPPPGNVKGHDLQSRSVLDGKAKFRLVHLTFGPEEKLGFDIAIFTPVGQGRGPFPTFVHISFSPTPGTVQKTASGTAATAPPAPSDPDTAALGYAEQLGRGYAVVTYFYREAAEDRPDAHSTGFFPAYPDYDWGVVGAWAWSMSRCVDYLQTQRFADKTKLIAVGNSRLGKATLIAGAFDERFALVAPSASGCFGTGAYRFSGKGRGGKEGLEQYTGRFPYHVSPRLPHFSGQVEKLPFDQHWLVALAAPRPFIAAEAISDQYCNGNAFKQTYLAALPVYTLLGVPAALGFSYRPGTHAMEAEDWKAILDFADIHLRGRTLERTFDRFPPPELLH